MVAFLLFATLLDITGIVLMVTAPTIVAWHARMYKRHYQGAEAQARLDGMGSVNPLNRCLIGRMSEYASIGPENPWAFPKVIALIRIPAAIVVFWTTGGIAVALFRLIGP